MRTERSEPNDEDDSEGAEYVACGLDMLKPSGFLRKLRDLNPRTHSLLCSHR